ncbi:MAG: acyl-CoA dehydrogenase family protein [Dehalococcoidia bacterium]
MKSMLEFRLTEEQLKLKETIKEFVDKEVKPDCRRREKIEDPAQRVPWDWITTLSKMGLRTMVVPEEYGGSGVDWHTICVAAEELAVGDLGLAIALNQTWIFTLNITEVANDEQRARYLPPFMADDTFLLAAGMTEPDAGSDHFLPYNEPGHGARTTAVPAQYNGRDGWVINGRKHYISNGGTAKLYTIMARTDLTRGGIEGLSAFFVELGTPGFTIGQIHNKIGQRLVQNAELVFDDCWVPAENLIGVEDRGRESLALVSSKRRRINSESATALGVGRAAFEDALPYAQQRVQGGKPIIQHQAIKLMLADMATHIKAARLLIWQAAWNADHPEEFDPSAGRMANQFASEVAFQVCKMAVEIFGGAGIMRESPVEKYLRDAATLLHSGGTNQINRLRVGDALEGLPTLV